MLVDGPPGALKTYGVGAGLFEAILCHTRESLVRLNVKGHQATREDNRLVKRLRPGTKVIVFAPGDPSRSCTLNLVELARRHDVVGDLVAAVVGSSHRGENETGFWSDTARRTLTRNLEYLEIESLEDVDDLLESPASLTSFAALVADAELLALAADAESPNGATCFSHLSALLTKFCDNESACRVTSGESDVDFVDLLTASDPIVFIIECNESVFEQITHVVNAVIAMLFRATAQVSESTPGCTLPIPVNIFLDEFGTIPHLKGFAATANLCRSRGVRQIAFVQTVQ